MNLPGVISRNMRIKALAVALAVVSWAAVVYAANPPDSRTFSVRVPEPGTLPTTRSTDEPARQVGFILAGPIPDLSVRVTGTREHVDNFSTASLEVHVDYNSIRHTGVQRLPLSITNHDPDVDLDTPPTSVEANVDIEDSHELPVQVIINSRAPQDYVIGSRSADPSTVTVSGPSHALDGLQAQVIVGDLSNRRISLDESLPVVLKDASNHTVTNVGVSPATVTVFVEITSPFNHRASTVLPVVGEPPPPGYQVQLVPDPFSVALAGREDILTPLDTISTQPLNLSAVTSDEVITKVHLQLPSGVTADPSTVSVRVHVVAVPQATPAPAASPTPTSTPRQTPRPSSPTPTPAPPTPTPSGQVLGNVTPGH